MIMDEQFLRYSGLDAACTKEIKDAFWSGLQGEFRPAYDLTMRLFPVLMFMQTRGVLLSTEELAKTKVEVLRVAEEKQVELDKMCGMHLNVNSPKQVADYFYNKLGIEPYRGKGGGITTDDLALQRLVRGTAKHPGLRQAKLVQDIRGLKKLYGTYLDLEYDADGRLRGSYNPRGTKFGRLSSSATVFGTGTNFQNLPEQFKNFLVADPGYCFMEVDKRQAEWVVVAYVTGDANMMKAIENGVDVHTHTAHLMFNVPYEIIKMDHKLCGHSTDPEHIRKARLDHEEIKKYYNYSWPRTMSLRQCGKKSNHGLNYGEGPFQFALINEIEPAEAKRIHAMYHRIYPGIQVWYEWVQRQLMKGRMLTNCFGRTVRFLGTWGDELFKSAYSMLPQSTVVDSLNEGMVRIYESEELCSKKGYNIDILAQVHDSVLMQVPLEWIKYPHIYERITGLISDYTSPELSYNARTFKIASDFKFGLNWGAYDKERNPGGMMEVESYKDFMTALEGWNTNDKRAEELA